MTTQNSHSQCLMGNWYEERFFHADHRGDPIETTIRPIEDEIENLPRRTHHPQKSDGVFKSDDVDPASMYQTTTETAFQSTLQKSRSLKEEESTSVTYRRMHTSGEELARMLDCEPPSFIPNYSLKPISPQEQFTTTYMASYRH